jgi:type I restriction enzyme R subunit
MSEQTRLDELTTAEQLAVDTMATIGWTFVKSDALARSKTDVLLEDRLAAALTRLNPDFSAAQISQLVRELRTLCLEAPNGLVSANEEFAKFLTGGAGVEGGGVSRPFGPSGRHVTVRLIDFEHPEFNDWVVTRQLEFEQGTKKARFDTVGYVNGIPLLLLEHKTPVRSGVSWVDGAIQVVGNRERPGYTDNVPAFFVPNLVLGAFDMRGLGVAAVGTPVEDWAPWRQMVAGRPSTLDDGRESLTAFAAPAMLLDLLRLYTLYGSRDGRRFKVVARYQQVDAARAIAERVRDGGPHKGLIWHFMGSGKSLVMLFAARALRADATLKKPPVLLVVDRNELDTQISGTFRVHDIDGFSEIADGDDLAQRLRDGARLILVTTIQKFREDRGELNSDPFIVLVDEAHRTQEGDFGRRMREALPNAFFFGMTGTPVNQVERNTFMNFGAEEDRANGGYMSKYSFADSIRDRTTVPLRFEHRRVELSIDTEALDAGFDEICASLEFSEKAQISKKAATYLALAEDLDRIEAVAKDVAEHFDARVRPLGFKALLVAPSRKACVRYKEAFDKLWPETKTDVVMTVPASDPQEWKDRYERSKEAELKLLESFRSPAGQPQVLIVTARLLTGWDAKIVQAMYLDKPMRDHTLLQAICRTARTYTSPQGSTKQFGLIVDYVGIFDEVGRALTFDDAEMRTVVTALDGLKEKIGPLIAECSAMLASVDRTLLGYDVILAADQALGETREEFAQRFAEIGKIWEALHPDPVLAPFRDEYRWLAMIYNSQREQGAEVSLRWEAIGPKTRALIEEAVGVLGVVAAAAPVDIDVEALQSLTPEMIQKRVKEIEKSLTARLRRMQSDPRFIALGERLEALKRRAEEGLLSSIDFLKELLVLARETTEQERASGIEPIDEVELRKGALTELFLASRNPQTPDIVRRLVDRIDEVVRAITGDFSGWQETHSGKKRVEKAVLDILLSFQLHGDGELRERVHAYIRSNY